MRSINMIYILIFVGLLAPRIAQSASAIVTIRYGDGENKTFTYDSVIPEVFKIKVESRAYTCTGLFTKEGSASKRYDLLMVACAPFTKDGKVIPQMINMATACNKELGQRLNFSVPQNFVSSESEVGAVPTVNVTVTCRE